MYNLCIVVIKFVIILCNYIFVVCIIVLELLVNSKGILINEI